MTEDTHNLSVILAPVLKKTIEQYQTFLNQPVSTEPKEFNAYHTACKAALGHVSLLMKLMSSVAAEPEDDASDLAEILARARFETAGLQEAETADESEEIYVEFD